MIQLAPILNMSISSLAMEDINYIEERYEKDSSRDKECLFILRKQLSQLSSPTCIVNCTTNLFGGLGGVFLISRLVELTCRIAETGLDIFLVKKQFDQKKQWNKEIAVHILCNILCVSRVAWEIFKLSSQPQKIFYYGDSWGFLAISEIASQILLLLVREGCFQKSSVTEKTFNNLRAIADWKNLKRIPKPWSDIDPLFKLTRCKITGEAIRYVAQPNGNDEVEDCADWILYEREEVEKYLNKNKIPPSWPQNLDFIKDNIKPNKSLQWGINRSLKELAEEVAITEKELLEIKTVEFESDKGVSIILMVSKIFKIFRYMAKFH